MANVDSAFGFRPIRRLDGAAWSGNHSTRRMLNSAGALNRGDVVQVLNSGYVQVSAAGVSTHVNLGVFVGCHYLSNALGYPIWSNYWPGSGAVGDVDVFVIDDPNVVFEVQGSTSTPIAFADIGINADFVVVASTTGFSKWSLNQATLAVTGTFPFRIVGLGGSQNTAAGNTPGNGYDHTTGYNIVEVAWNDQFYRQQAGI